MFDPDAPNGEGNSNNKVFIHQITRNLINFFVNDLVNTSMQILNENKFLLQIILY